MSTSSYDKRFRQYINILFDSVQNSDWVEMAKLLRRCRVQDV